MENEFILYISSNEDIIDQNDSFKSLLSCNQLKIAQKDKLVKEKKAVFYRIKGTSKNLIHFIKKADKLFPKIDFELFEFRSF